MNNLVVVSGLWRSGSSLMMQILEKSGYDPITDYNKKDEHNENGYYEINEKKTDTHFLDVAANKYKKPCVKILAPFLENNKLVDIADLVIFMQRDIHQVYASTLKTWGKRAFKRKMVKIREEGKSYIEKKEIQFRILDYNLIMEDPKKGLMPIKFILDNFEECLKVPEKRLYKCSMIKQKTVLI